MQAPEQPRWRDAEPFPTLVADEIHLWYLPLDTDDLTLSRLADSLQPFEHARAARLQKPIHRRRFIAARARIRELLARYRGCTPSQVRFHFGPRGKPFLRDHPTLHFNASDSGGHALFGFCEGRELGVDIEALPRTVNAQGIARRKFAAAEYQALQQLPPPQQTTAFLRCWTRKEAYGKARGTGIHYPMQQVHLCHRLDQTQLQIPDHEHPQTLWTLCQLEPPAPAVATLVVHGEGVSLKCFQGAPA